ncbi:hypothetical protein C8R45DRAFT_159628 [Mycena sanguinolenta]|nr:hypothetical protein C8R45DRAFT_159628 [Mycena sanguinolenta]
MMSSCPSNLRGCLCARGGMTTCPPDVPRLFRRQLRPPRPQARGWLTPLPSRAQAPRSDRSWARTSAGEDVLVAAVHYVLVDAANVLSPRCLLHPFVLLPLFSDVLARSDYTIYIYIHGLGILYILLYFVHVGFCIPRLSISNSVRAVETTRTSRRKRACRSTICRKTWKIGSRWWKWRSRTK